MSTKIPALIKRANKLIIKRSSPTGQLLPIKPLIFFENKKVRHTKRQWKIMTQIFTQFIQGIFWQDSFSNDDSTSVWCISELENIRNSAEKSQFKVLYSLFTGNIVSRIDKCLFHVPATIMGSQMKFIHGITIRFLAFCDLAWRVQSYSAIWSHSLWSIIH